MDGNILD